MSEEEIQGSGHAASPSPALIERATYIGTAAFGIGGLSAVFGMGSISLAFAALAGVGGGFFAEEIHETLAKRRKGVKLSQHRFANMDFWLRGDQPASTEPLPSIIHESTVQVSGGEEVQGLGSVFPPYPENERLDLGSVLATSQRFAPHFNALFGKGVIASAVQGSGKSQLLGRIIEQAAKCGVPMVVCDHKGEYAPVTELSFVRGLHAGSAELKERVRGCKFFELNTENVDEFVAMVMEGRYQAIIDLSSYGDRWLSRAEIVAGVGQALMRYAAGQRRMNALLLPCLVALDEAQLYIPQNANLLPPEARKNSDVLDSLNNAYFALVSNGRSNGYTVVFATQSLTYVAKWAIKSCQIKVFGRHAEKNDLDMCGEIINPKIATREDIENFAPGVGVVFGFTPQPMVVKFDLRLSRDDSETPGLERLRMSQPHTAMQERVAHRPELTVEQIEHLLTTLQSRQSAPVYSQINNKQPINGGVYPDVNEPVEPDDKIIKNVFINREINEQSRAQNSETGAVSSETRKHIRGMVKANISHREISKIVGLYGPKYKLYQQVCTEEGIKMEKDA